MEYFMEMSIKSLMEFIEDYNDLMKRER